MAKGTSFGGFGSVSKYFPSRNFKNTSLFRLSDSNHGDLIADDNAVNRPLLLVSSRAPCSISSPMTAIPLFSSVHGHSAA